MTEADVLRGQELIEAIQATKEIIAKLKTGIKAEISDVTIRGFEKNSKGESASMRHSTEKYEFQLNVSRSVAEVTGVTHNYLASLLSVYERELIDLEAELSSIGKDVPVEA